MDDDIVDETNLQRQTIFTTADVGRNKGGRRGASGCARSIRLSQSTSIPLRPRRAKTRANSYGCTTSCSTAPTVFRLATRSTTRAFWKARRDVYASIFRFDGQVSVFGAPGGPCYRCLYPEPPPAGSVPTCAEGGVLGALAGIVGAWQANEALKMLLGIGEPLAGRLMLIDSLGARVREVRVRSRSGVRAVRRPRRRFWTVAKLDDEDAAPSERIDEIDAEMLDEALREARLLDVREPHEAVLGTVVGAMPVSRPVELEARMHELDTAATLRRRVPRRREIAAGRRPVCATPDSHVSHTCAADCWRTRRGTRSSSSFRAADK